MPSVASRKRRPSALTGLTIAATSYRDGVFATLVEQGKRAGAEVSGTVHRRVHAVVATASAVLNQTQRVRKARDRGVPVVTPEWLAASVNAGEPLSTADFQHNLQDRRSASAPGGSTHRNKVGIACEICMGLGRSSNALALQRPRTENTDATRVGHIVDFGCCCSCHDEGHASCSWCHEYHAADVPTPDICIAVASEAAELLEADAPQPGSNRTASRNVLMRSKRLPAHIIRRIRRSRWPRMPFSPRDTSCSRGRPEQQFQSRAQCRAARRQGIPNGNPPA